MLNKKPNKGHKNVDTSEEKKAAATARLEKRVYLLEQIVDSREVSFVSMENLPKKLTEFVTDDWLANDVDRESVAVSRATYYQTWNKEKFERKLNNLFERIKNPKKLGAEVDQLQDKVDELELVKKNLMEANLRLEQLLAYEVILLKKKLKASEAANRRLQEQLNKKADVIPFNKPS
ncbi:conserved hypothetical protein [Vibrio crassostreae]|nr:conserved hypothetical protein [Vibrio crassostreae]